MNNRQVPYEVQSGIVTLLLTELLQKHPELRHEVEKRLEVLPEQVGRFIWTELTLRPYPYDLKELTKLWSTHANATDRKGRVINARPRFLRRR
jgi:hypothetical protein